MNRKTQKKRLSREDKKIIADADWWRALEPLTGWRLHGFTDRRHALFTDEPEGGEQLASLSGKHRDGIILRITPILEAAKRIAKFADAWDAMPITGLSDEVYSIHGGEGTPHGATIRLSDIRALRDGLLTLLVGLKPDDALKTEAVEWAMEQLVRLSKKSGWTPATIEHHVLCEVGKRYNIGCQTYVQKALGLKFCQTSVKKK